MRSEAEISKLIGKLEKLEAYAQTKMQCAPYQSPMQEMWKFRLITLHDQLTGLLWVVETLKSWPNELWYPEASEWLRHNGQEVPNA